MQYIRIDEINKHADEEVQIKGWVTHIRSSGKLIFIEIRDGSERVQCVVYKGDVTPEIFETADGLTIETSLMISGSVRKDTRSKLGYEIGVKSIQVVHQPKDEFPISPKEHGVAFLHEQRHLWIRSSRQVAILRIRATIVKAARDFLDRNGFILFDTPILTPTSCEGTSTLFETPYFSRSAYLTQSGQLYDEAGAMALGRVYSFGPTFRAEKSKTRRHLTEFWMVEPEAAFFDLDMDMKLAEEFVAYIVSEVLKNNTYELETLERNIVKLETIETPFPRISYDEAIDILKSTGHEVIWGDDLGGDEETVISNRYDRPVLIHRYPVECKAFYMKSDPQRSNVSLCCDMLAPEGYGEIIGGGQREDDYETLLNKIKHHKLDPEPFQWYLDLRRYGSVPHAGFGLGIERTVAWLCGLNHVRETIPFPRLMDRIHP
ncbi:MAG: asparagine--tRNA ligase [Candidatus Latescibacteria bacterium]|nr:asparagine--tRNA ligase [Candidatus Latescibacterota bacterium]